MAKKKCNWTLAGKYAFLIGLILAVLAGIVPLGAYSSVVVSIIVILGLLVGLINISAKETMPFLIASVVLVLVAGFGSAALANVAYVGLYLRNILGMLMTLIVPAAIIVSLKELYVFAERR